MRWILVEKTRRKRRLRHGGGLQKHTLAGNEPAIASPADALDLLTMNEALDRLETTSPHRARADADANLIRIDDDAAGHGWFVDPTPWDDAEFATPGNQGEQHRMDLLTVLTHELGHLLGYDHAEHGVMEEALLAGTRQTPTANQWEESDAIEAVFAALLASPMFDSSQTDLLAALISLDNRRKRAS